MDTKMFAWEVAASLIAGLIVLYIFEQRNKPTPSAVNNV